MDNVTTLKSSPLQEKLKRRGGRPPGSKNKKNITLEGLVEWDDRETPLVSKPVPGRKVGRPKGSGNRLTAKDILESIHGETGRSFAELLAEGYHDCIREGDRVNRIQYEKMFLSKVVADLTEMTVEQKVPVQEEVLALTDETLEAITVEHLRLESEHATNNEE